MLKELIEALQTVGLQMNQFVILGNIDIEIIDANRLKVCQRAIER